MNCFCCGKKKRGVHQLFYKLGKDGNEICQSCYEEIWGWQYVANGDPEDVGTAMKKLYGRLNKCAPSEEVQVIPCGSINGLDDYMSTRHLKT